MDNLFGVATGSGNPELPKSIFFIVCCLKIGNFTSVVERIIFVNRYSTVESWSWSTLATPEPIPR